ncbi:competence protein CoiA [Bacillus sp. 2205SS5-2]|uniref:competence protein CoiA n=1 Tax=Bacillus sp. 2205SS5-2 TaxID=3109031 RepID=UPI003004C51D
MLTATKENGEIIVVASFSRKDLMALREKHFFYCPQCGEKLILKVGKTLIPHFAHYTISACVGLSEPESALHLQGKKELFQSLSQQKLSPKLEKTFRSIHQRADIFVEYQENGVAIEYQCSPLSTEALSKRTNGYKSIDIDSVWILGCSYQERKKMLAPITTLSESQLSLLTYHPHKGFCLPIYSPKNPFVFFILNPIPIGSKFLIQHCQQSLKFLRFPPSPPNVAKMKKALFLSIWRRENAKWLRRRIHQKRKSRDPFLDLLYQDREYPLLLSEYIGVPVEFMITLKTHPIIWQYFVWRDSMKGRKRGEQIRLTDIFKNMKKRIEGEELQSRELPLCELDYKQAVYHYVQFLERAKVLEEIRGDTYIICKVLKSPSTLYEAIRRQEGFFSEEQHILKLFPLE